jgi:hypothetical protein
MAHKITSRSPTPPAVASSKGTQGAFVFKGLSGAKVYAYGCLGRDRGGLRRWPRRRRLIRVQLSGDQPRAASVVHWCGQLA